MAPLGVPCSKINMAGGGLKHVGKMFVPGLTPQMVWTFRDSQAPVQVRDGKPLFCYKFLAAMAQIPNALLVRDLVVARFDQKKDHRELQTTSGGNMFTFKSGLSKDRLPDIEVTELDPSTFLVSPKEALAAGEYILSASAARHSIETTRNVLCAEHTRPLRGSENGYDVASIRDSAD